MTAGKKPDKIGLSGFPAPYKSNASPGSCGYVHSADTGLYYLQSRYYNPSIGRFINADIYISTGQGVLGNNMFAYCRNNPVCRKDASGTDDVTVYMDDGSDGTAYNEPIDEDDVCTGGTGSLYGADTVSTGQTTYSFGLNGSNSSTCTTSSSSYGQSAYYDSVTYSTTTSTSNSIQYTPKATAQMTNASDLYHSFPSIIDNYARCQSAQVLYGGDGYARSYIRLFGAINGVNGYYEYIFEADGSCNHRLFQPWEKG